MLVPFNSIVSDGGPMLVIALSLAVVAIIVIIVRRFTVRRMIALGVAALAGALLGWGVTAVIDLLAVPGAAPSASVALFASAASAAIAVAVADLLVSGRLVGQVRIRSPRQLVSSIVAVALFATAGGLGVTAAVAADHPGSGPAAEAQHARVVLPSASPAIPTHTSSAHDDSPLWSRWTPPPGMPVKGQTSHVDIPNTASGFVSRSAGLYLPPAALVADPPPLPFVIMLMGQPGKPDPAATARILDRFAATHHGLAPIVLVPDQIGAPTLDPMCVDSVMFGKVETFLIRDVPTWARANLHILQDAAHWTIAGYSNGGECALSLGAKYPQVWKNVIDVSGELFPGSENPAKALAGAFAGDQAAYDAQKPLNILAAHDAKLGRYTGMTGIFTVGSDNNTYVPQAKAAHDAARDAGWHTTYFEIPMGGHRLPALLGGLEEGYTILFPILGLSNPAAPGDPNPLPIPRGLP